MPALIEWSPVTGCSPISPGCTNCKAMRLGSPVLQSGLVKSSNVGPMWTGAVRLNEAELKRPTKHVETVEFVVCPHGDLFHENVADHWLDLIFGVMEANLQHFYQVLTKRAARMQSYFLQRYGGGQCPSHIVLSVSAERQREADERIPLLQATPAVARFVTLYPLLGLIDLSALLLKGGVHFVLAGEEPERPADPAWFDRIAQDCARAGVPFVQSSRLVGEAA